MRKEIAGVVTQGDAPVSGAVVRLVSKLTASGRNAELRVTTDALGQFDFGPQLATSYVVVAEKPHATAALTTVDLENPVASPPPDQLVLVIHGCDASVHGTIHDAAGGSVARARVSRVEVDFAATASVDASEDGTYELCVPVGGAQVVVTADGYAQVADRVTAYGAVRRDFALVPEANVLGRVVRESDHSPVAGALVEVTPDDPMLATSFQSRFASSDEEGRFHVEGLAPGPHAVSATADHLASVRPAHVVAEIGRAQEPIVCALAPTTTVAGKVVEHGSGAPRAGVKVRLVASRTMPRFRAYEAVTQADGTFATEEVLPGEYNARVDGNELTEKSMPPLRVADKNVDNIVLEVEPMASISGRVLRAGKPIDGAQVEAQGSSVRTVTDATGRYALRGLLPGTYRVYAESKREGIFSPGPSIAVAKGEQRSSVDVELNLNASIAGTVVDQTDAPVKGVFLRFSLLRGNDFGVATTSDDGTFIARALSGGGDYVYEVRPTERSTVAYHPAEGRRFAPVTVRDGQSHVTGLRVKVRFDRLSIAGHVIDADGKPVPDVAVRAARTGWGMSGARPMRTDMNGAFTFRDLDAGNYDLLATATTGTESRENIAAGTSGLVLRLTKPGDIDGKLEGFSEPVEVIVTRNGESWVRYEATIAGDTFRVNKIPAGTYQLMARSPTGMEFGTATVPAGGNTSVTLHQRGFGSIEGTLLDEATHAPLSGFYCEADSSYDTYPHSTSGHGSFRLERVLAGNVQVTCQGPSGYATASATVLADQSIQVNLFSRSHPSTPKGHIGMTVEQQLGELRVSSIESGGPAARAGLSVGDVLLKIDDHPIQGWDGEWAVDAIESKGVGSSAQLSIERGDKQMSVGITVEATP